MHFIITSLALETMYVWFGPMEEFYICIGMYWLALESSINFPLNELSKIINVKFIYFYILKLFIKLIVTIFLILIWKLIIWK